MMLTMWLTPFHENIFSINLAMVVINVLPSKQHQHTIVDEDFDDLDGFETVLECILTFSRLNATVCHLSIKANFGHFFTGMILRLKA